MSISWLPRLAGLFLLAAIFCGVPAVICLSPAPAYAQWEDISVPGVPDPVCAYCDGAGCSECQPTTGDDGTDDEPDPWEPKPPPPPKPPKPVAPPVSVEGRKQQEIFAREKKALLEAFKMPELAESALPVTIEAARMPNAFSDDALPFHAQQAYGLSDAEWARARACQAEIDSLYQRQPLSAKDIARLDNLLTERNILWDKAANAPGLNNEDRARLRMTLSTVPPPGKTALPSITALELQYMREQAKPETVPLEDPLALAMMRQNMIDSTISYIESEGEDWAGDLLGDAAGSRFGTVLGLTKVVIAAKEDTADGLAALGDVLVGLIPIPQASFAVSGGRVYGNTVYQAMNNFMTKSMQMTGGTMDTEAFWKELDDGLSVNTRAYRKWVGFGP